MAALSVLLSVAVLAGATPSAEATAGTATVQGVVTIEGGAPGYGTIQGVVTIEGGGPVLGRAPHVEIFDSAGRWFSAAHLAPDGSYSISVPSASYFAHFQGAWNAFDEWYDDADACCATGFYVGPGATVSIDFQLAAAGMITGTVTEPDGSPRDTYRTFVSAYDSSGPYDSSLSGVGVDADLVDETYYVGPLPTGDYYVELREQKWYSSVGDQWWEHGSDAESGNPVHVVAGSATTANFTVGMPTVSTIGGLSPGFSPIAGGQSVTISGWHLTGATSVTFDGAVGTDVSVASDTSLTVTTPAHAVGSAQVVVSGPDGDSDAKTIEFTDASVFAGIPTHVVDVWKFTPGVVRCYQVTGMAGVPVGAVGVTLNVTASLPDAVGHLRVYPDYNNDGASTPPAVSTVNFEVNRDVANSTTVALPEDGKVCAYSVGGTLARLIFDVEGYTLPGSGITLITPEKLVDTRSQSWYHVGSINGPVQPMTDYNVQVGGVGSVPADAVAVMVNVTVVDTNYPGHLRMWASDQPMPNTSVVNYAPETKANSQIVALSASGELTFRSFSWVPTTMSPVQVLIDVTGFITAGSDFTATVPTTIVETRPAYTPVGLPAGPLAQSTVYPLELSDTSLVPADATAVVLNVTAVQPTNFGHIRVYPDTNGLGTTTPPSTSNLNFIPGRDIPNMVIVQLPEDRTIDFYTAYAGSGHTDLKVDLIGYIGGTPG